MTGLLRSAVAETIATLLFVFTIITAINTAGGVAAFAIGFGLMVLVYAFGHISGAHLNPAVSLGVWLRGKMTAVAFVLYSGCTARWWGTRRSAQHVAVRSLTPVTAD